MNEQELIELGEYCERILSEDTFHTLVKLYEQQTFQTFTNTEAKDTKEREVIFASFNGVKDFLGLMKQAVETKSDLLKRSEPALSEETDALPQDLD